MQYYIHITRAGGNITYPASAITPGDAHRIANTDGIGIIKPGDAVSVYPDVSTPYGALMGALMISRISAWHSLSPTGGTPTQRRIYADCIAATYRAVAAERRYTQDNDDDDDIHAAHLTLILADGGADMQDYIGAAALGIYQGIDDGRHIDGIYRSGYKRLNVHILSLRAATMREISTEWITDRGGDIIAYGRYIGRLSKPGDRYTAADTPTMPGDIADDLAAHLQAAAATLSPRQQSIVRMLGCDMSQRAIQDALHLKSVSTVNEHIAHIRSKYLAYFCLNAPEWLYCIDDAAVQATIQARRYNRHKR